MADNATKQDIQELSTSVDTKIDKAVADLSRSVDTKIDKAVSDLSDIIAQFGARIDERFNTVEARLAKLEENFDRLQNTLNAFLKRLDDIEIDNQARDAQIARLERWIETIAQKTGVKLEH